MKRFVLFLFLLLAAYFTQGQGFSKPTIKANRDKFYQYLINKSILENLSYPLDSAHEENWQTAFWTITFVKYKHAGLSHKISEGFEHIDDRGLGFQRAFLELLYTDYKNIYQAAVMQLLRKTNDAKIFAMCAEYMITSDSFNTYKKEIRKYNDLLRKKQLDDPILQQLTYRLDHNNKPTIIPAVNRFFEKSYLPGVVVAISFQRSNRDYTGITLIRDTSGNWLKNEDGSLLAIPQLARSASNMSGYLSNGNTPEGIFRMEGFGISKSNILGPSMNIQLTMPYEYKAGHFFLDEMLGDNVWDLERYKALLPASFQKYYPTQQAWFAGKAGRTEVIAHGTTVDPSFYVNQPYYPISPTQGCLCTKEIWDEKTGKLLMSDQVKLVEAIKKAGGPHGYYIVLNLDDKERPVLVKEIELLLKKF